MSRSSRVVRISSALLLGFTVVAALGGCKAFRKGPRGDYALSQEQRPLEVPPDLTLPDTSGAMAVPSVSGGRAPLAAAPADSQSGFTVPGQRDQVFERVGTELEAIEGLTIASRAQLLGTYDVAYRDESFLVRVAAVQGGVYVSAVDPRGVAATGPAAVQVIASLQAALAR
ncbi:hypothetical protein [Pseudoxanthomonas suwonensis]|uniref:hypothetical protein n=1 Tax=Pseudoxanthomonas suwonensis TaxID=314722 RepID=UPI00138F62DE|nr:hypothetical protein [Pseudoxanthomonas suwonensis]KAF1704843.1 hypothetical protein CSC68_01870 [Pseudoxanthomonas suwonensis]